MSYKRYENSQMNILGETIKRFRQKKQWSQQELCNKLELVGVYLTRSDISLIELNKRVVRDFEILALSYVFNVSLEELYRDTPLYKLCNNK